jgi:DNA polymerase-3 subunit alpha
MNGISGVKVNRGAAQALIMAGAFDYLGKGRGPLHNIVEEFKKTKSKKKLEQIFDFNTVEWNPEALAKAEKEALGFYLSGHPVLQFRNELLKLGIDLETGEALTDSNRKIIAAGYVDKVKPWQSKNGEMAFVDISGFREFSICVWATSWNIYNGKVHEGDVIVAYGRRLEGKGKLAIDTEKQDRLIVLTKD